MGDPKAPLFLMRHGETVFNAEGRYQGGSDSRLTEAGRGHARVVGEMLAEVLGDAPVRLVVSPQGRAMETAEIAQSVLPTCVGLEVDARFREVSMGAWDGHTRAEIAARWPDARAGRPGRTWIFHGPGGESLDDMVARLDPALQDVAARADCAHVLISHGLAGRILRALHAEMPLEVMLEEDAPQDAAYALEPGGSVRLMETAAYRVRMRGI
ncbi:histidine phosphatase family protein [Ovoidimarina sediminis]|uniref:histidine phosphatase family protein n=1 Tax=Ovoidimarina sediminis TaxID=3079856 RepID=UPI0029083FFB|nr:histidine phosphatase family protein [Rhodophyticola sp. MJ-SS7]MDU8944717.1 histidine phosphatase family protein [Rhodophyticola sp. MJ-SS7]